MELCSGFVGVLMICHWSIFTPCDDSTTHNVVESKGYRNTGQLCGEAFSLWGGAKKHRQSKIQENFISIRLDVVSCSSQFLPFMIQWYGTLQDIVSWLTTKMISWIVNYSCMRSKITSENESLSNQHRMQFHKCFKIPLACLSCMVAVHE